MQLKLTGRRSGVFAVKFEHISHRFLVLIVNFEQVNIGWEHERPFPSKGTEI